MRNESDYQLFHKVVKKSASTIKDIIHADGTEKA